MTPGPPRKRHLTHSSRTQPVKTAGGPGGGPTARVVIVDDDASVIEAMARALRLEGCEVWAARSADEGLALARTHRPDAVILDLRRPLGGGVQFLRAIRGIPGLARTPVAIVTGDYTRDAPEVAAIRALGGELRYKPLWLEELIGLAHELLHTPVHD